MMCHLAVGRWTLVLPLLTLVCALPAQAADSYPSRPIRLVVGFATGDAVLVDLRPTQAEEECLDVDLGL